MEKEFGQVKITETDDGYKIEVSGKKLKDAMCCCMPMIASCRPAKAKKPVLTRTAAARIVNLQIRRLS